VGWTVFPGGRARLRIAMVSTPWVPVPPARYGGTELVVSELVNGLVLEGHEVVLFATGDSRVPCALRAFYPRAQWPPESLSELVHSTFAAEAIRAAPRRFDLVHAHVPSFLALEPLLDGVPVVYTLHHDRDERLARYYASLPTSIHFVAISGRQASHFPELEQRSVVHHGLNPDAYPFGERHRGYLAFLGRYSRVKGPDVAIEVARRAGRPIYMGGKPHDIEAEYHERLLAPLLAEPHVHDLGELAHGAKTELLAGAEALLFPIRWDEPFGLVMIEAMFCGCPVVAFRGGSVEEVVEHGVTGFLADDPDHMVRLVRERVPRLDRRRVRARAIERFSSRRMVRSYLRVYEEAIARQARPRRAIGWTEVAGR